VGPDFTAPGSTVRRGRARRQPARIR